MSIIRVAPETSRDLMARSSAFRQLPPGGGLASPLSVTDPTMKSFAPSSTGAGYPRIDEKSGSHSTGSRGTRVLTELHVSNLAVMEEVQVQLGPGLNVLTGETGAGKSLVVGAIASRLAGEWSLATGSWSARMD